MIQFLRRALLLINLVSEPQPEVKLDDSTFLIYHYVHSYARLTMINEDGGKVLKTTENNKISDEECWYLRPEPNHPGYHYIESCIH
jgi:hypothetical protein